MDDTPRTVAEILKAGTVYLAARNVETPRIVCELLLGRLLGCKRLELPLQFEKGLTDKQLEAMRRGIKRAADGEPVQYVIGQAEFMGHVFKADRRALIPRPETEILVEWVLETEAAWRADAAKPAIVDVGTGSGCIVISLALARPEALYIGLDISEEALALARENAQALGTADRVAFACGELCDAVDPGTISVITANLPYVATEDYARLPVLIRGHEPRTALDGGEDGLRVIEPVTQDAALALRPGGRIFLEIAETQAEAVRGLLGAAGFEGVEVRKDLAGKDRVVSGVLA